MAYNYIYTKECVSLSITTTMIMIMIYRLIYLFEVTSINLCVCVLYHYFFFAATDDTDVVGTFAVEAFLLGGPFAMADRYCISNYIWIFIY